MARRIINRKYSVRKKLFLAVVIPVVLLLIVEMIFRIAGRKPRGSYLKDVSELIVYNNFCVDQDGLYKADTDFAWDEGIVVNRDGFRSPEFDLPHDDSKRIMLLGDSFAWGYTAAPLSNAFADLLNTDPRFTVFNLGIPGTGFENYVLTAQKYIDLIKPDVVLLVMDMSNDINLSFKPTKLEFRTPAEKQWIVANAGIFLAVDENGRKYDDAETAYQNACTPSLKAVNMLRRTAFGTWLVNALYDLVYKSLVRTHADRLAVNGQAVEAMQYLQALCQSNQAAFIICPVPVNPQMTNTRNSLEDNALLFTNFNTHPIAGLTFEDYAPFPDAHLNNIGHHKTAAFLSELIEQTLDSQAAR